MRALNGRIALRRAWINICGNLADAEVDQTSATVVMASIDRLVLTIAAKMWWPMHYIDYDNAFVQVTVSWNVYKHTSRLACEAKQGKVCLLT